MGRLQAAFVNSQKSAGEYYWSTDPRSCHYYKLNPDWHEGDACPFLSLKESDKQILINAGLWYTDARERSERYYKLNPDWHEGEPRPALVGKREELEAIIDAGGYYVSQDRHSPRYIGKDPRKKPKASYLKKSRVSGNEYGKNTDNCAKPRYTADFETRCSDLDKAYGITSVWLWCVADVSTHHRCAHGSTIESFMEWLFKRKNGSIVYFHNLAFDGKFIMSHIAARPFEFTILTPEQRELQRLVGYKNRWSGYQNGVYCSTLISELGQWYNLELTVVKNGYQQWSVSVYDSLKIIPFAVEKIAKDFKTQSVKGDCDYTLNRPVGYQPTEDEIDYCATDCEIVAEALNELFAFNLTQITAASCALTDLKSTISNWDVLFPKPEPSEDALVRLAYNGGFTAVNDDYFSKIVGEGIVLDVNSMYPHVMRDCLMPHGKPLYYEGNYDDLPEAVKKEYPLYVQRLNCNLKHKPKTPRMVQSKEMTVGFICKYIESQEDAVLTLTSVDLQMMKKYYNVGVREWCGGLAYQGKHGMFNAYIDKWTALKTTSKGAKRAIAKLMLNSVYGKFGTNPLRATKTPVFDWSTEKLCYIRTTRKYDEDALIYLPVACFITSYARKKLTDAIDAAGWERFCYCDTDSVHILGKDVPDGIEIHESKLGAWKVESEFDRAKFLHTKAYLEESRDENGDLICNIALAGCPKKLAAERFHNCEEFDVGSVVENKMIPKDVRGGVILYPYTFEINNLTLQDSYVDDSDDTVQE